MELHFHGVLRVMDDQFMSDRIRVFELEKRGNAAIVKSLNG